MTLPIIIIACIFSLILFLISSLILFGICKLFRINEISYKKIILISLLGTPLNLFAFLFLIKNAFVYISTIGVAYFIFYLYFRKYYQVSWIKSFLLYITNNILGILILTAIVIPFQLFIFQPFVVSGNSMIPNINDREYLVIKKFLNNYERDDVVIYKTPVHNLPYISRIIALPTENILIKDGIVYINGKEIELEYTSKPVSGDINITLENDQFFVIGDNSSNSRDSRALDVIKLERIVGKVIYK